jgi:HK97 family phage major capsid protein
MRNEALPAHLQEIAMVRKFAIDRELEEFWDREQNRRRHLRPRLNLARTVLGLSMEQLDGEDREALEECARQNDRRFDPLRPFVEFRDLSKAVGSLGGFTVQTEICEAIDILRPWSVTVRAGMLIESGLIGDLALPKVSGKSTPTWVNSEATQITASTPTLVQAAMTPKTVGNVIVFSRQLRIQTNAERFVARELLRTIGTAIDQAVINGSGASGQPLGLLNTSGVQTQSGTNMNAGVLTMKQKSAEANAVDEQITFLSTPAVRQLLETRERATGGGEFVWQHDQVADRRAYVSTDVPTATMISGDWGLVYLGIWGNGFVLEINPYDPAGFKAGTIQARLLVSCDVGVLHPSAFIQATSIT